MKDWCNNIGELDDFLAFVLLKAPDRFPAHRNMDLAKAFQEINSGIKNCAPKINDSDKVTKMESLSKESESAYMAGNDVKGAHLIQELAEVLTSK